MFSVTSVVDVNVISISCASRESGSASQDQPIDPSYTNVFLEFC